MTAELPHHRITEPLTVFLIGATGDLSRHKILKAFYALFTTQLLPSQFTLVGIARAAYSQAEFAQFVKSVIQPADETQWQAFASCLDFVSGDVTQAETFNQLKQWHSQRAHCGNHLWYIATLPSLYPEIVQNLQVFGSNSPECGWTKCLLEKPFGTDVASALELDQSLAQVFNQDQIYRIDHFLAKETVQNILVFRFANGLFENMWNKEYIDHIQIHSTETIGIAGRERFYDQTGTVRDVVQNHVLHLLATALMEQPATLSAADIRTQRSQLLKQLQPLVIGSGREQVAYGQYTTGLVEGQAVAGYKDEKNMPPTTTTETAVALKCFVNNDRWQGVPIYIRAGKRLNRKVTEISFQFKEPKNSMFSQAGLLQNPNVLTLRIDPHEGFEVKLFVKKPGIQLEMQTVPVRFEYKNTFSMDLVEAYVKLIYDAVNNDPTLFPDASGIEACWRFVQPLLDQKSEPGFQPAVYPAGSRGPQSFAELIEADGRHWYDSDL